MSHWNKNENFRAYRTQIGRKKRVTQIKRKPKRKQL